MGVKAKVIGIFVGSHLGSIFTCWWLKLNSVGDAVSVQRQFCIIFFLYCHKVHLIPACLNEILDWVANSRLWNDSSLDPAGIWRMNQQIGRLYGCAYTCICVCAIPTDKENMEIVKGSVVARSYRGGRNELVEHGEFCSSETTLGDISIRGAICHYIFVQICRRWNTKKEL